MLRRRVHLTEIFIKFSCLSRPFTHLSRSSLLTHTIVIVPALVAPWSPLHITVRGIFFKNTSFKRISLASASSTNLKLLTLISESYSFYLPLLWNMLVYPGMTLEDIVWWASLTFTGLMPRWGCPLSRRCPSLSNAFRSQGSMHSFAWKLLFPWDENGAKSYALGIFLV